MKRVMACTPAVLLIALGLALVSMAQAPQTKSKAKDREVKTLEQHLGVTYSQERLETWAKNKAHNWLIHKAFQYLSGSLPGALPAEGLDELMVHYGVVFADNPWYGRPETISSRYPCGKTEKSAREGLWGTRPVPAQSSIELKYEKAKCAGRTDDRPNLYLNVRLVLSYIVGAERTVLAVDNASHYPHDTKLRADGAYSERDVVASGPGGVGPYQIKGEVYALKLYELARQFWPDSSGPAPSLDRLTKVERPGRFSNTLGYGPSGHVEVPATYLGGNPFILTRQGGATWPIWAPDGYQPSLLVKKDLPRSRRTAAIYLGWSLHIMQDLAYPYHAVNQSGPRHTRAEGELDRWAKEGKFDHLPVTQPWTGTAKYKYSKREVYRPAFWTDFQQPPAERARKHFKELPARLQEITRAAKACFDDVCMDRRLALEGQLSMLQMGLTMGSAQQAERKLKAQVTDLEAKSLGAQEYMLDVALKNTILMMGCLVGDVGVQGVIQDQAHRVVSGATVTVVSADGKARGSGQSDSQGRYRVELPQLGQYSVTVSHPSYQTMTLSCSVNKAGHTAFPVTLKGGLPAGTGLRGRVKNSKTNQPVRDVEVQARREGVVKSTRTSSEGYYRLAVPAGTYTVTTRHPDFRPSSKTVSVDKGIAEAHFLIEPVPQKLTKPVRP